MSHPEVKRLLKVFLFIAAAAFAAAPAHSQEKVAFKLMGGLANVQGDDYNKGALGAYRHALDNSASLTGSYATLGTGADFQAEIVSYWGPKFGVGIGGGFYRLANTSDIAGTALPDGPVSALAAGYEHTSRYAPKLSVLPFFLNFHYKVSLKPGIDLDVFAGPVFQILQFGFMRRATSTLDSLSETETFNASDTTLGVQGGLSVSLRFWRWASFVADGFYRSGKVSNIKGNWFLTRTTTSGTETTSDSSYYYWYYDLTEGRLYPQTGFFDADGPTGDDVSNARKANINLTGLVFLVGLRFSL